MAHHQVLIVGGGSAGLYVGALLRNSPNPPEVTIIEPSEKHYYQPIWTLVGAGVFDKSVSERNEADYIPSGANWIREKVASFDPDNNSLTLANGDTESYDILVVAAGIQINWGAIPGLKESVGKAGTGICSNYSFKTVGSTWDNIKAMKSGTALFTQPNTPIKCGGAPQKIMYLAANHFAKKGISSKVNVKLMSPKGGIFPIAKYAVTLNKVIKNYGIETNFGHNLVEIHADKKEADFEVLATGEKITMKYDMMHVTPPQGPMDFIKNSPIAAESGWVDVDMYTTQHNKYSNVFSLGDCSSLPTSKTGAAIRKQAPATVANIQSLMAGEPLTASYNGYTSCPLVTGYGKLVLAEFSGYEGVPMESFPFDQAEERYSMYALKAYGLPRIYWHGMLKGREF